MEHEHPISDTNVSKRDAGACVLTGRIWVRDTVGHIVCHVNWWSWRNWRSSQHCQRQQLFFLDRHASFRVDQAPIVQPIYTSINCDWLVIAECRPIAQSHPTADGGTERMNRIGPPRRRRSQRPQYADPDWSLLQPLQVVPALASAEHWMNPSSPPLWEHHRFICASVFLPIGEISVLSDEMSYLGPEAKVLWDGERLPCCRPFVCRSSWPGCTDSLKSATPPDPGPTFILVIVSFFIWLFGLLGSSPTKDARSGIRFILSHPLSFDAGCFY